jgi:hypothetical protein
MGPREYTIIQKKQLVVHAVDFSLIVGQLYKMGPEKMSYGGRKTIDSGISTWRHHKRTLCKETNNVEGS